MIDDRDKLNIDSPYFDPEKYLLQILANNNVPQLVNKCNELQIGIETFIYWLIRKISEVMIRISNLWSLKTTVNSSPRLTLSKKYICILRLIDI